MDQAYGVYTRAFRPVVIVAAIAGFGAAVIAPPSTVPASFLWYSLVTAIAAGISTPALLALIEATRRGEQPNADLAIASIQRHGVRFAAATVLLLLPVAVLSLSFVGLPLAFFLVIRLALYGPAIVFEESDITDGFARSWGLIRNMWVRTCGVLVAASAPLTVVMIVLFWIDPPFVIWVVVSTAAWALVAPYSTVVTMLLFEDYRRVEDSRDPFDPPPRDL
jgi:hypothetical protein